jgi:hypothetical protein
MKALPLKLIDSLNYEVCGPEEATHVKLNLPVDFAPLRERIIPVQLEGIQGSPGSWTWNGSTEAPSLWPSLRTKWEGGQEGKTIVCHSWIKEGSVLFLSDSNHSNAGKTLALKDVDP